MTADLTKLTIAEARDALAAKDFTALELTDAHLAAIERASALNAFITGTADQARVMAKASDARRAAGQVGALEGIPLAIKDLFCTDGVLTTAASHILDGFKPPYDSTVTTQLWQAGAVMLGKTNLDEFAMGSSNETSFYGNVVNPWRQYGSNSALTPGGSSGGSATAVAARLAMGATGTDTGGSIRQPASFTGIVGLKPTYGRVSRWGIVAFASSLDQAGPMTRTVRDAAIMLGAMSGFDPKDSTSADLPVPDFEAVLDQDLKGVRIGVPDEYRVDDMPEEIERLWQKGIIWLKEAGAEIKSISLPHTKYALPVYYIVAPAEASSNLSRYVGVRYGLRVEEAGDDYNKMYERTRGQGFGAEVRRRVLIGTYVLSAGYYDAYYLKAQKIRRLISDDFKRVYQDVDAILTPATPSAAFALGDRIDDPLSMYLNDVFTVPGNLSGIPGISVPVAKTEAGLPLGLQVLGPAFDEEIVFKVGHALERAAGFNEAPDDWWNDAS
jgi:aspartyl-tRNA(Asn)/glutamyl-tRNA(Gln) amidotransferase subunit A